MSHARVTPEPAPSRYLDGLVASGHHRLKADLSRIWNDGRLLPWAVVANTLAMFKGRSWEALTLFGAGEPRVTPATPDEVASAATWRASLDADRLRDLVRSFPAPRSRIHHPEAMFEADELILSAFRTAGWDSHLQPFHRDNVSGYLDLGTFQDGNWGPTVYDSLDGVNVVAIREGVASTDAVLVLAHHDTVRDSPGANDNTAGVVALIEVARLLGDRTFDRTVILAAVDMEEIGLHGSEHLAETVRSHRDISSVIVLETLAYLSSEPASQLLPPGLNLLYRRQVARMRARDMAGDFAAVLYRRESSELAATFASALEAVGGRVIMLRDPADLAGLGTLLVRTVPFVRDFARSDHKPFWERGDAAILVTDTANFRYPHYHQPTDTPEQLDYRHLADITVATAMTVERCAKLVRSQHRP